MGFQMKQANLRPRGLAAVRRIAGHAQEDHFLDPYQQQQKLEDDTIELRGAVERQQKDDIVRLARHQEEAEKSEHPLNRIISIDEDADGIVINTTDIHLPRRIGEAVERAFHGSLNEDCDEGGYFVRVNWTAKI